jgi:hypothetical protein
MINSAYSVTTPNHGVDSKRVADALLRRLLAGRAPVAARAVKRS